MASRSLIIATLVGATVGVPYLTSKSPPAQAAGASGARCGWKITASRLSMPQAARSPDGFVGQHRCQLADSRVTDDREPCGAEWDAVYFDRSGAAIRCIEGVGLSELGSEIDRADGRGPVRCSPRAVGDGASAALYALAGSLTYFFNGQGQAEHIFLSRPHGRLFRNWCRLLTSRDINFSVLRRRRASRSTRRCTMDRCRVSCGLILNRCSG